jgi:acyl-CoA thioester hydrolase
MRHDPRRLQLDLYPYRTEITLRFADLDAQSHANNVRIAEYYQEARLAFMRHLTQDLGYQRSAGSRTWVAHQSIDYLLEVMYPGTVIVGIGVSRIGTTSWSCSMGLFAGGRCAGLSTTVLVYGLEDRPAPIPQSYRTLLERFILPADRPSDS